MIKLSEETLTALNEMIVGVIVFFGFAFSSSRRSPTLPRFTAQGTRPRAASGSSPCGDLPAPYTRVGRSFSRTSILYETFKGLRLAWASPGPRLTISIIPRKEEGCQGGRRGKKRNVRRKEGEGRLGPLGVLPKTGYARRRPSRSF